MLINRLKSSPFAAAAFFVGGLLLAGCSQGDVGAPCNHGTVEPPTSKLVTFPALSCSDLLCVYGEEQTVPETACSSSAECNSSAGGDAQIFECVNNACRLSLDYVLERSMCSKTCSSDDDCNNTSLNNRPAVDDDETSCSTGFSCTVLQRLGQFCCQRLCVCRDDLDTLDDLEAECEPNTGEAWLECYGDEETG
ncbi:hypothetical protein G6O69_08365 [Pseudenhygromyxa sp. WMMC2535]|uniref:hypothetical protein n=1 Tax=Pseudenhygromyxa sp. WMMC2535 TaxID=2712867 RepID=UPI00155576A0|nr:hypothetical protein [Pseudenhygromyxa sp. WMMC2535]NVB37845.1 hypothetical protein [Pseudenhygromyxa sp. WMMC2535]